MLLELPKIFMIFLCALLIGCAPTGPDVKTEAADDVYLQLGVRYLSLNKLEIAKENLELALQRHPDSMEAHTALAFLYEKINRPTEAAQHYETAMNLAPNDLSVQNNYGRFLCDSKQYDKGMALLTKAASNALNDKPWLALTNAGRCQLGMNRMQQAEAYFRQALQVNPAYPPALQEMQKISYKNSDFWSAKGFLQRYLAVAEHTPETLLVAAQTEYRLGNPEIANEYHKLLIEKFPLSDEAKQLGPIH